jgi:phosphatidylethanolamine-binding protein (PEBP) family uncharacterized protein
MRLKSPVELEPISAHYTCDGADVSLPLRWRKVPADTVEFDLIIAKVSNVPGRPDIAWGVAGLEPNVRKLSAGRLPRSAIVGRNTFGQQRYQICPEKGTSSQYVVLLFALTHRSSFESGFDTAALAEKLLHMAIPEGQLGFFYRRR